MVSKRFNLIIHKKISSFRKTIEVDADKSMSIRSFLIGAIAQNISSIKNALESDDVISTIKCLKKLGVKIKKISKKLNVPSHNIHYLVFQGSESNQTYNTARDEIKILYKNGQVKPMSESSDYGLRSELVKKQYLCYPKGIV